MNKRAAVFSCLGLGDGLIALVLSNNLKLNDFDVTTFHPTLASMQNWFPSLPIRPYPGLSELEEFDHFFFIYEKSPWMLNALQWCEGNRLKQTHVLNPIATMNRDYPYWVEGKFKGDVPVVDNLYNYCSQGLNLPFKTRNCGIVMPEEVTSRKFQKRVILHPTSSRKGKNWKKEQFEKLAYKLCKKRYDPVFVMSPEEMEEW